MRKNRFPFSFSALLVVTAGALAGLTQNLPASATSFEVTCSELETKAGVCTGDPSCPTIKYSDGCTALCGGGGAMVCDEPALP